MVGATKDQQGHRQRLRERFMQNQGASMPDYELLELVLMYAIPRQDVKPIAKDLLRRFGSYAGVLGATTPELKLIKGLGTSCIVLLHLIAASQQRAAKEQILDRHVISNWQALLDYCRVSYSELRTEEFHALLLDQQNHVIEDLVLGHGSVSEVVIYPREVVKQALDFHAQSLVLVHNHPGGSANPSKVDIQTTTKLKTTLKSVDITLFDHLIVARGGEIMSFKEKGIL